jgi:imidazolonepropionase-like amidohydrolase
VDNLSRLLDDHAEHVGHAHELGVAVLAGSDAGSPGVDHGGGLIDELLHLLRTGLPMQAVLRAATSLPRDLWNMPPARIAPGSRADMILLEHSPFDDPSALRNVRLVVKGGCCVSVDASGCVGATAAPASASNDEFDVPPMCISPCPPER